MITCYRIENSRLVQTDTSRSSAGRETLISDIRDSLMTLDRAVGYYAQHLVRRQGTEPQRSRAKTITRDLHSIGDHANFLSNKITLLLDATLGMINIEQNAIIKIFSVAAVVFLPPTLIASIYGMNFDFMPELKWPVGYPPGHCAHDRFRTAPLLVLQAEGLALRAC